LRFTFQLWIAGVGSALPALSVARTRKSCPTLAHGATKRMIRAAVDEGVYAADDELPRVGAQVIASEDLQRGVRTLQEKGPGQAEFEGR
jgi:enoyl-CoA hydratase/carnithine racemase